MPWIGLDYYGWVKQVFYYGNFCLKGSQGYTVCPKFLNCTDSTAFVIRINNFLSDEIEYFTTHYSKKTTRFLPLYHPYFFYCKYYYSSINVTQVAKFYKAVKGYHPASIKTMLTWHINFLYQKYYPVICCTFFYNAYINTFFIHSLSNKQLHHETFYPIQQKRPGVKLSWITTTNNKKRNFIADADFCSARGGGAN